VTGSRNSRRLYLDGRCLLRTRERLVERDLLLSVGGKGSVKLNSARGVN